MPTSKNLVWQHNSYRGHARMMMMQCLAIKASATATDESRALAQQIYELAADLAHSLRTRKDSPNA